MSILLGKWNFDGTPISVAEMDRLSKLAKHDGDGSQFLCESHIAFRFSAYHTTPESAHDEQPLKDQRGRICMWDGRLDNRGELIRDLDGHFSPGLSDAAIACHAFERWGTGCFQRLLGDWAISIWDPIENRVILARDYIGVKHLYYCWTEMGLTWCNFLEPLALSGRTFRLCDEYVAGFLGSYPDANLTPYQEIRCLPPASYVCCSPRNCAITKYWKFDAHHQTVYPTDRDYEEEYRYLLKQAIACRLRSSWPVLAELSGGLDSSAVVCLADDLSSSEEYPRVDTFSYFDPDEPDEDDLGYFSLVEARRGRKGHHAKLESKGDTFQFDENQFSATPIFQGREEIRSTLKEILEVHGYRVVLSGLGGDEVNGMALDFRVQVADLVASRKFGKASRLLFDWSVRTGYPWIQLAGQTVNLFLPSHVRLRARAQLAAAAPWITASFAQTYRIPERALLLSDGPIWWKPSVRDAYSTVIALQRELTHLSPFHFEKRYPFLDRRLLEFLFSIPTDQLLRPDETRSLMRRALREVLPQQIWSRSSKSGTGRCASLSIAKHWQEIETLLREPFTCSFGYFEREPLFAALHQLKHGQESAGLIHLIRAISLELWLSNAVQRRVICAEPTSPVNQRRKKLFKSVIPKPKGGENHVGIS